MTSAKQIAANRRNGPKSRGPRTAAGKSSARHNALRHGLAAVTCRYLSYSPIIERIARAICADEENPRLFEQALAIAENEVVLLRVRAQRVAAIERQMAKDTIESRDAFAAMREEFAAMRHAMSDFGRLAMSEELGRTESRHRPFPRDQGGASPGAAGKAAGVYNLRLRYC
ncbi:MAG TPA: hypothetical protein VJ376_00380 [Pseudomonadota bacterium]|nr:hypothetical protein [Pseudomonadota bacterium]